MPLSTRVLRFMHFVEADLWSAAAGSPMRHARRLLAEWLSPELRHEADEDPLTGAFNKRADQAATTRALAERRPGTALLRLRADLDNFKALNDHRGHLAGDRALRVVHAALVHATRNADVVSLARPGGDEFAVTLRVATGSDAEAIRDRIEDAVNAALGRAGFRRVQGKGLGISIGVACVSGWTTVERLDAAADAAALQRKRARGVSEPRAMPRTSGPRRAGRRAHGSTSLGYEDATT